MAGSRRGIALSLWYEVNLKVATDAQGYLKVKIHVTISRAWGRPKGREGEGCRRGGGVRGGVNGGNCGALWSAQ